MSASRVRVTQGKASLIGGIVVGITAMVLWTAVTHELGFAREVSNRMVFMDGGQIVEAGTPEDILISPQNPRTQSFISAVRT